MGLRAYDYLGRSVTSWRTGAVPDVPRCVLPADETNEGAMSGAGTDAKGPTILLYSDDVDVREQVRLAVGPRLRRGAPDVVWVETATAAQVIAEVEADAPDLLILDGEAGKVGGMGLARQLKDEIYDCPPMLLLTGRPADAWLASWSDAEGVVSRPLDPAVLHDAVVALLDGPGGAGA